jgi:hypothetical protein
MWGYNMIDPEKEFEIAHRKHLDNHIYIKDCGDYQFLASPYNTINNYKTYPEYIQRKEVEEHLKLRFVQIEPVDHVFLLRVQTHEAIKREGLNFVVSTVKIGDKYFINSGVGRASSSLILYGKVPIAIENLPEDHRTSVYLKEEDVQIITDLRNESNE